MAIVMFIKCWSPWQKKGFGGRKHNQKEPEGEGPNLRILIWIKIRVRWHYEFSLAGMMVSVLRSTWPFLFLIFIPKVNCIIHSYKPSIIAPGLNATAKNHHYPAMLRVVLYFGSWTGSIDWRRAVIVLPAFLACFAIDKASFITLCIPIFLCTFSSSS